MIFQLHMYSSLCSHFSLIQQQHVCYLNYEHINKALYKAQ